MYHEVEIEWRGRTLDVACMLPSPCFPRNSLAIVGVYDVEQDENIVGELWGTEDALEIRALVEQAAKSLPLWPANLVAELRDLAVSAPNECLRLLASATADTLEHGAPRTADYRGHRVGVPDKLDEDRVIVASQVAPKTAFAVIGALGVDLVGGAMLLELRVDRGGAFIGALRLDTTALPGPSVREAWNEVHPMVDWILLRSSSWSLIPDDLNAPSRHLWLESA